jgi:hypothetical protein
LPSQITVSRDYFFFQFFKLRTAWNLGVCYKKLYFNMWSWRKILKSFRRWKKAENNSNLLQCYIELKFLGTIIALIIRINKTLCNSLY